MGVWLVQDTAMTDFEVIDAFFDGERVDSAALKAALASGAGRDYLVDVMALREITTEQLPQLSSSVNGGARPRSRWFGVAAAVLASLAGGYVAGRHAGTPASSASPGTASSATTAPAPTSVIRFEQGVDWHEYVTTRN